MEPIIQLEQVDFFYDRGKPSEVQALKNINLAIRAGEYVSFLGPSGCGKTTLLHAIAGIELPTSGKVLADGMDLTSAGAGDLAVFRQTGIGIVFQNFNLIPSLRNVDNVALPMSFLGMDKRSRLARAYAICEKLGIADLAERFPHELSGGQQQRVGIARALANDPPILLADEPTGNLDSASATVVLDLLREINREGKTIVMVTHEAWSLRDVTRVFYLRDGAITKIEERTPAQPKQIGSSYYYRNLFTELPEDKVRARALAFLILRGYSEPEMTRFAEFLEERLSQKIGSQGFRIRLNTPFKDGGLGLWRGKAERTADYIEKIITEQTEIDQILAELEKNPPASLRAEIHQLRRWLVSEYSGELNNLQLERLDESIEDRVRNVISADDFRKVTNLSQRAGGVGLRIRSALKLSADLEMLLGRPSETEASAMQTITVK